MNSIAEIFNNSKQLLDSIGNFFDKYIGCSLLRRCGITKMVDAVTAANPGMVYSDNPILRILGDDISHSAILEKLSVPGTCSLTSCLYVLCQQAPV